MKLSVLMPVYNEKDTIEEIIQRVQMVDLEKELIIVDDCSTDGTKEILQRLNEPNVKILCHSQNLGKGAAVKTALEEATGEIIIIQDADLEYSPEEYPKLIEPILKGKADVVYGSRFLGVHQVFMFWHFLGNKFLTFITNILYNTMLTDMETCYKAFRAEVLKKIRIRSNRFNFEPEVTAKVFKQNLRVYEIPITYEGRDYKEGKKITWRDGISAIWALLKYRFVD